MSQGGDIDGLRKEVAFLRRDVDHIRSTMNDMHREVGSAVLLLSRFIGLQWDTSEAVRLAEERSTSASEAVDRLVNNVDTLKQRLVVAEESKTVDRDPMTIISTDKEIHSLVIAGRTDDNNSEESRGPIDGVHAVERSCGRGRGRDGDVDVDLPRCKVGLSEPAPSVGGQAMADEAEAGKLHQPSNQNAYEPDTTRAGLSEAGAPRSLRQTPARGVGATTAAIELPACRDAEPRSSRLAPLRPIIGDTGYLPYKTLIGVDTGELEGKGPIDAATIPVTAQSAQDTTVSGEAMVGESAVKRDATTGEDTWPRAGMDPVRNRSPELAVEGHTITERTDTQDHMIGSAEPGQIFRDHDAGGPSVVGDHARRGVSIPQEKEDDEEKEVKAKLATAHLSSADRGGTMEDAEVSSGGHRNDTRVDNSRDDGNKFSSSSRSSGSWTSRSGESHTSDRSIADGRNDADHAKNWPSSTVATLPAIRGTVDGVPHRDSDNERLDEARTREGDALLGAEKDNASRSVFALTQKMASSASPVPSAESDSSEKEVAGLALSTSRPLAPISMEDQGRGERVSDGEVASRTPSNNSGATRDRQDDSSNEDFVAIGVDSADDDAVSGCTAQGAVVVAADGRSTDALVVAAASPQAVASCDDGSDVPAFTVNGQSTDMSMGSSLAPLRYSGTSASGGATGEPAAIINQRD